MIKKFGVLGIIGLIADIITLSPLFKRFFVWCGVNIEDAAMYNKWILWGGLVLTNTGTVLLLELYS